MTATFDDPNREAVGLEPIWTSADPDAPEGDEPKAEPKAEPKDPEEDPDE